MNSECSDSSELAPGSGGGARARGEGLWFPDLGSLPFSTRGSRPTTDFQLPCVCPHMAPQEVRAFPRLEWSTPGPHPFLGHGCPTDARHLGVTGRLAHLEWVCGSKTRKEWPKPSGRDDPAVRVCSSPGSVTSALWAFGGVLSPSSDRSGGNGRGEDR